MNIERKALSFEAMKYERWPSAKRVLKVRTEQLLARAEQAATHLPKWRLFKRLGKLEDKVDKPFIHDSGLSQRVDDLEAAINQFLATKKQKVGSRK